MLHLPCTPSSLARRIAAGSLLILGLGSACDLLDGGSDAANDAEGADAEPDSADSATRKNPPAANGEGGGGADATPGPGGDEGGAPSKAGPAVWQAKTETAPVLARISGGGVVVGAFAESFAGFSEGGQAWSKEGTASELLRLQSGSMLATIADKVIAFDPATGDVLFEVQVPSPTPDTPPRKGRKPPPPPPIVAADSFGSQVLLALADARFFVVDPPACGQKKASCLRAAGELEGEFLEASTGLTVADDGTRFLREEDTLRAFDAAFDLKFSLTAHKPLAPVSPAPSNRLGVAFGGEIALLDTAKCESRMETRLARAGATVAPRGCVMWRYEADLDTAPPAVAAVSSLAANGNQRLQVVAQGSDSWKSPLGSLGRVISSQDGLLYTATVAENDEQAPAVSLSAVDAERGTVAWSVPLGFDLEAGAVIVADAVSVDYSPGWISVAIDNSIAVVALPAG